MVIEVWPGLCSAPTPEGIGLGSLVEEDQVEVAAKGEGRYGTCEDVNDCAAGLVGNDEVAQCRQSEGGGYMVSGASDTEHTTCKEEVYGRCAGRLDP